jgi:hypothetical protein
MPRLLLHLLLSLLLALGGLPVAWSQVHGGGHHGVGSPDTGHCGGDAAVAQPDAPPADTPADCCGGSDCHCGCVLPPALAGLSTSDLALPAPSAPVDRVRASEPPRLHDRPLRPPTRH